MPDPYTAVPPPTPQTIVMTKNEAETFLKHAARWQDRSIELLLWRNPPTDRIRVGPITIILKH